MKSPTHQTHFQVETTSSRQSSRQVLIAKAAVTSNRAGTFGLSHYADDQPRQSNNVLPEINATASTDLTTEMTEGIQPMEFPIRTASAIGSESLDNSNGMLHPTTAIHSGTAHGKTLSLSGVVNSHDEQVTPFIRSIGSMVQCKTTSVVSQSITVGAAMANAAISYAVQSDSQALSPFGDANDNRENGTPRGIDDSIEMNANRTATTTANSSSASSIDNEEPFAGFEVDTLPDGIDILFFFALPISHRCRSIPVICFVSL